MSKVTKSFAEKVAAQIGAPADRVFEILSQWEPWENANAAHNPLATTQRAPGSGPLGGNPNQNNGNPVQEYPSEDIGAKATADTLLHGGGGYPAILTWLRTGELDSAAVAKEIGSKWGTTGFANQVAKGAVKVAPSTQAAASPAATRSDIGLPPEPQLKDYLGKPHKLTPQEQAVVAKLPPILRNSLNRPLSTEEAQAAWQADHDEWLTRVAAITSINKNSRADQPNDYGPVQAGIAQQGADTAALNSQISLLNTQVNAGQIDANTAQAKLTAWLSERTQAQNEAKMIADAKDQVIKYGVAPGHEKDTASQWGDAFVTFAKLLGGNENSIPRDFTGQTIALDPEGDLRRMRQQNGSDGPAPEMPSSTAMADLVNGSGLLGGAGAIPPPPDHAFGEHPGDSESPVSNVTGLISSYAAANPGTSGGLLSFGVSPGSPGALTGGRTDLPLITLPSGYGATSGLGDASTPANATGSGGLLATILEQQRRLRLRQGVA